MDSSTYQFHGQCKIFIQEKIKLPVVHKTCVCMVFFKSNIIILTHVGTYIPTYVVQAYILLQRFLLILEGLLKKNRKDGIFYSVYETTIVHHLISKDI